MTQSDTTITVDGMTCAHCVAAVTEEVERVPGVRDVEVSLDRGTVSVVGDDVSREAIRRAVDEAGYRAGA